MPKRNLRVLKWLGTTPAVAICAACNLEFKVPLEQLKHLVAAQDYLQVQFSRHECQAKSDASTGARSVG